jgi:protein SCO1
MMAGGVGEKRGCHIRAFFAGVLTLGIGLCSASTEAENASPEALIGALLERRGPIGGPFALIDHAGQRRTDADFRGRLVILYFGYTHCPDVCPTELQTISLALDALGPASELVQPLFITLDPSRDTQARLAEFAGSFHPRLIGLTGELADIRKVALAYKVFFARSAHPLRNGYAVDHTGFIYLVDSDGQYLDFIPPGPSPEQIVAALRPHLARLATN